jgi:metallo-beta-lactamase family protein
MAETKKLKITFASGAGTVTGANFLLEGEGKKFLIDCGLVQNSKLADEDNWDPWIYDPKTIDILFITHAHIDHIGRIPKLIHDGFAGRIISTEATHDLARPMLLDTVNILSRDKEHGLDAFYNEATVEKAMSLWEGVPYHQEINIDHGFRVTLKDAGHILGSAMVHFVYNGKTIVFTGDLGNSPSPLLRDTETLVGADYVIMESVYGDRNHEHRDERRKIFETIIEDNYKRGGTLIIPTFSLERTQELLFEINYLVEGKRIPQMPIYLDSPLAIKLTGVYRKHLECYNEAAQKQIAGGDDVFMFPGLKITPDTEDSKEILHAPDPKIIIAGSGMSNGGRIIHHEHNYLPNPNNTLLLTGYQSQGTMGRKIEDGAKTVRIFGEDVEVRAHIAKISGYSGHKDSDGLINFVENFANSAKRVFVVMGEPKSSLFLVQRLRDYLGVDAIAPMAGDVIEIEC